MTTNRANACGMCASPPVVNILISKTYDICCMWQSSRKHINLLSLKRCTPNVSPRSHLVPTIFVAWPEAGATRTRRSEAPLAERISTRHESMYHRTRVDFFAYDIILNKFSAQSPGPASCVTPSGLFRQTIVQ